MLYIQKNVYYNTVRNRTMEVVRCLEIQLDIVLKH